MICFIAILSCVYASLEGVVQAFYYRNYNNTDINIHGLYTFQRAIVGIILFSFTNIFFFLFFLFSFSFFHNGFYYWTRNILDDNIYRARFTDTSTTSKAFLEFNFSQRTILFIMGLIFFYLSVNY